MSSYQRLYISANKWVLPTAIAGGNIVFHPFLQFFNCFTNFCFILKQKGENALHSKAGSLPNAALAPCEIIP